MAAIRLGGTEDLGAVAAIQAVSEGAAKWGVADYLEQRFLVAEHGDRIVGFLVWREVAGDEGEILNLAVVPESRRTGVAKALMEEALRSFNGTIFLEVRESNEAAKAFYKSLGFQQVSAIKGYYNSPPESAIVMKFHSC